MRVTLLLILFFSVTTKELVHNLVLLYDVEITHYECPENQSEKENQENFEDESESDFFNDLNTYFISEAPSNSSKLDFKNSVLLPPTCEIFSPPPEC